jgi:amino acid permease
VVLFLTQRGRLVSRRFTEEFLERYRGVLRSAEDLVRKLVAGRLFRRVSIGQIIIHLSTYIASFIKLIIIEAGGYYDTKILLFIGMTAIAMPLFWISGWLIQHSLKISNRERFWGYCFHLAVFGWSVSIVAVSYLR